jgi:hypothetical protein
MSDFSVNKVGACVEQGRFLGPSDDGSFDWYMSYGPSTKNEREMRRRRDNDIKRREDAKREESRLMEQHALEKAESEKIINLPAWPNSARGVPNSILRGSLFAAIQERYARNLQREVLHHREGLKIVYSGTRLTQSDLDVWELLLHLARKHKLGDRVYFRESFFLKLLDRNTGKREYEWLKKVIARLKATSVEITHNEKTYGGSLIDEFYRDESAKRGGYYIVINPKIARLYDAGHTYINWEERKLLGKKRPLAQWLHGYISSHSRWVPHKVETIRDYSGSETKELRKFKAKLKAALDLLLEKKLIIGYSIDSENMLHIDMS